MKYRIALLNAAMALLVFTHLSAQPARYSVANAHSHNDYVNPIPFYTAYNAGFGSIEADIFLVNRQLLVSHDPAGLAAKRTLEQWYLRPLDSCVRSHNGYAYADKSKQLILLIDIKNAALENLDSLVALLKRYPALTACPTLKVAITGDRPDPSRFTGYPGFIWFDGVLSVDYSAPALSRIVLFSDNLRTYVNWKGSDTLITADHDKLRVMINRSHALLKPVRFWNAPDNSYAWAQFKELGVDYINTDHIPELAAFLGK